MGTDRARRDVFSRPAHIQVVKVKTPEAQPIAPSLEPGPAVAEGIPDQERGRATSSFPLALTVMIGLSFGGVLGLAGWPMLQAFGVVEAPAIETVQRNQADLISQLDATVQALNAAVLGLRARVDAVGDKQDATSQAIAEIDTAVGTLRKSMHELRETQNAAKEPVAELAAAAAKAHNDIIRLRASVDELSRRQPESAATSARINRLDRTIGEPETTGSIRGSIGAQAERPSSAAPREKTQAGGHIFELKPAQ